MTMDFSDVNVLLIGDFMLDHYVVGKSNRMSPEAPVPVIIPQKEYSIPGGAGNVAMNLSALGANVKCIGCVGNDDWGHKLISILNSKNIKTESIEVIDKYPTTLKQRIYIGNKQVARIDKEEIMDWQPSNFINEDYDIVILSDYNKGVLNKLWFNIDDLGKVIVDPKKASRFSHYKNSTIITPNLNELHKASEIKKFDSMNNDESIISICNDLIKENNFEYIIAKRGSKGITIIGKNKFFKHIGAHKINNPDVTGAGDTVIAALSIAYAKTNDIEYSTIFANAAAGIVVGKTGTATCDLNEVKRLLAK
tara:strand:+ start:789 stop:1712 length:924 start_codon:yes stop_codon:yes gene_type:complete